ncbi:hypothetical protein ACQIBV_003905 [Yersinia enterocolitica]|uniref:beta-sandwich lipoprotein n=1 Tax=Yersinia TaxID=629 RepID=UPI0005E9E592|nr:MULTISPECIES: hypothetical protein [Yersinia]UNA05589.1 conotoxin [Yersinia phage vB_YenM_06.16-1]UNA05663.1 hypothetical protein vBYenM2109_024 [Yersinia phage vB_YenM_21.09]EKN3501874.1 hypothetical protein [Yersinia enterocolitica]EKN3576003.1 hypothetical protein [Yersinia enterocolitica]EKN3952935.1 hypothetical protein [Yersinia enterocolitica]
MKKTFLALSMLALTGCDSASNVASKNLSTASDNFEIQRRFVFYNGITGDYILTIEGLCSKDNSSTERTLGVVCKTGPNTYKKQMLGLSDNVTWFMEQIDSVPVSEYHYRVIFRPSVIIPDVEIK